jgi:hypothetical protein
LLIEIVEDGKGCADGGRPDVMPGMIVPGTILAGMILLGWF